MRVVELGELCQFFNGGTPSKAVATYWNGSLPWITSADISDGAVAIGRSFISANGIANSAAIEVPAGTILLVSRTGIGKVAQAPTALSFSQDITAIQPGRYLNQRYLVRFLEANKVYFERHARGATIKGITREAISRLKVPLLPLPEQRRIAVVLDQADILCCKRKRAIELLDSLAQSIFLEMFVEGHDPAWPVCTVDELATDIRTGPFGSQLLHSEFVDEGIAVLGIDNAVSNEFQWSARRYITPEKYKRLLRYTVKPHDVLITIMGTCGRCAVVPEDIPLAINTKHLCCITLDARRCLPEFLHAAFLRHPSVLEQLGVQAKGAVMPGLNMGIIKSLQIPMPPVAKQQGFAEVVQSLREQGGLQSLALDTNEALFSSLQQRAFSGQL